MIRAVENLTGFVCLRNLSIQGHTLSALFVTDVCIENQLLNFLKIGSFYICKTCAQKLNENQTSCQTLCNKLQIYDFPIVLRCIHRLERVLIVRRLQFKKVITTLKDLKSHKFKGEICNVPTDVVSTCNTLPRPADSNGLVTVKLKRKLEYRIHVYFEPVRPR